MIDEIAGIFAQDYNYKKPGYALAVISDGKILFEHYQGLSNLDNFIPISSITNFRIASLSKEFTAICIRLLEEEEKITLEDKARKYIPELPEYAEDISIYHLLHHTSGLREFSFLLWGLAGVPLGSCVSEDEVLDLIARQEALFNPPGIKFRYSNTNYFLLGIIISRVTGMSLAEYAEEKIFTRLRMNNTNFHDDWTNVIRHRATGYSEVEKNKFAIYDMPSTCLVGDDGLFTNIKDWYFWDQNFYKNKLGNRRQMLIRRMFRSGALDNGERVPYASGLFVKDYRGQRAYYHHGDFLGFQSYHIIYPELQFSIIAFANYNQFNPKEMCQKIEDKMLDYIVGEDFRRASKKEEKPKRRPKDIYYKKELPLESVKEYLGDYYSEEIRVTYTVEWKENKLILKNKYLQRKGSDNPLERILMDKFMATFWNWKREIDFYRDAKKNVLGFTILDEEEQIKQHKFEKVR